MSDARDEIEVTPAEAKEMVERGDAQLIDVREPHEWAAGHIAGARHIALELLATEAGSIDRERPIVFHCRVGARSAMAAQAFRASGYGAFSMAGGLLRWHDEGLPLEPADGHVADH